MAGWVQSPKISNGNKISKLACFCNFKEALNQMSLAYIGLGSNLGDKEFNLRNSIEQLNLHAGKVLQSSSFYVSAPLGFKSENMFLNAVVLLETSFTPLKLLRTTQNIEKLLGRKTKKTRSYEDRIIDIDILLYDQLILNHPKLTIPHPHIAERDFVIRPLTEIATGLIHPATGKLIIESLK